LLPLRPEFKLPLLPSEFKLPPLRFEFKLPLLRFELRKILTLGTFSSDGAQS
jgi:hypothetical protein